MDILWLHFLQLSRETMNSMTKKRFFKIFFEDMGKMERGI